MTSTPIYDTLFRPLWMWLTSNHHPPEQFQFSTTTLPLTSAWEVYGTLLAYYAFVHLGQRLIRRFDIRPIKLRWLFFMHNAMLSLASLGLLATMLENILPRSAQNGLMWSICHADAYDSDHRLEFLFYINYVFKYYELLDTVFLVLKRKPVPFLHWFHHSMTMLLCYAQLVGKTPMTWLMSSLNLAVHVLMYYYYARTAVSSSPVWWKRHLTTMQIIQFIIDLAACNLGIYAIIMNDFGGDLNGLLGFPLPRPSWGILGRGRNPWMQSMWDEPAGCAGSYTAALVAWTLLNSYLVLFIRFFRQTYRRDHQTGKRGIIGAGKEIHLKVQ